MKRVYDMRKKIDITAEMKNLLGNDVEYSYAVVTENKNKNNVIMKDGSVEPDNGFVVIKIKTRPELVMWISEWGGLTTSESYELNNELIGVE